eukprot:gene8460-9153_t
MTRLSLLILIICILLPLSTTFPLRHLPKRCGKSLLHPRIFSRQDSSLHVLNKLFSQETRRQLTGISIGLITLFPSLPLLAKDNFPLFEEVWSLTSKNYYDNSYNGNNWNEVKKQIQTKLESGESDEKTVIKEMLKKLNDKYSRLYDEKSFQNLFKYDAGGIGLIFESDSNTKKVFVSSPPIPGSSGDKAGLKKGDIIYSLNGISTNNLNAIGILEMLSNDNSDRLTLEYSSSDNIDNKKTVTLDRVKEKVVNPVKFRLQVVNDDAKGASEGGEGGGSRRIGYIQLKEFNSKAVTGMKEALDYFNQNNIDFLLLDLRGNTGGGFQFALNIGGMFMNDKVMATAIGRGNDQTVFKTSYPSGVITTKPLVVVTDGLSASATEALVAGLRDNCRAIVAGSRSFGKGKIQGVFGLNDGEGLTLTVAQYLSPKGHVIQTKGIEPDLPLSVLNPYINYLLGNQDLDITKIDFNKALDLLSTCKE